MRDQNDNLPVGKLLIVDLPLETLGSLVRAGLNVSWSRACGAAARQKRGRPQGESRGYLSKAAKREYWQVAQTLIRVPGYVNNYFYHGYQAALIFLSGSPS